MRLAFYSSILCQPNSGGPVQIHRHFKERADFEFIDLNPPSSLRWDGWISESIANSYFFQRLCRTRLFPWITFASVHTRIKQEAKIIANHALEANAEALVTVAYDRRCYVAQQASKIAGIPLITIFHDWWPDLAFVKNAWTHKLMDRQFRKLYRSSDLALCVCEEMRLELGAHKNSHVLLPIPSCVESNLPNGDNHLNVKSHDRFQLVYLGTLQGRYGELLRRLVNWLIENGSECFDLKLYGPATEWPEADLVAAQEAGIYQGVANGTAAVVSALSAADGLLVVMNFDEIDERRVKTSFPSKLPEYCNQAKPIIVWGPSYCSAYKFMEIREAAYLLEESSPESFVQRIDEFVDEQTLAVDLGKAALYLSEGIFDPDYIHLQLCQYLNELLNGESHDD